MLRLFLSSSSIRAYRVSHRNSDCVRQHGYNNDKHVNRTGFINKYRTFSCVQFHEYNIVYHKKLFSDHLARCHSKDQHKTLVTSSPLFVKRFMEFENLYAYEILERNPSYCNTLAAKNYLDDTPEVTEEEFKNLLCKDWSSESAETIFMGFKEVSLYSSKTDELISEAKFDNIVKSLLEKCSELSDDSLIGILSCLEEWSPTEKISSPNFVELWNAVDKQCFLRMGRWDRNKLLFVADHWNLLHLVRASDFMWHCISRLSRKPEKLTPPQLVQCMFYLNARRRFPPHIVVYDFEFSLQNCIEKLSIEEISILAMGFFKTSKPIVSQNLLMEMIRRIMSDVDSIHEISLAALLKVIRYSLHPNGVDTLLMLLDKLVPQVDRLSLLCLTHVALAGSNIQVCHEELMKKIVQRFVNEIERVRLKDLERIAFALSLYNYEHKEKPSIYELIAEELCRHERSKEIQKYPKCLSCCLHYLSLQKIYMKEEISKVLDMDFIHNVYGSNNYKIGREILSLDVSVELECPDYNGKRLKPKVRKFLSKIYSDKVWQYDDLVGRKLNATDAILFEVVTTAISILGGQEKVHLGHLLPHLERADITYGIRSDGRIIDIPSSFRHFEMGICKKPPDIKDTKWYCIIIGGWNSYIRNLRVPVGTLSSKLRHLQLLGYNPILVPWFEWRLLSAEEQEKYLTGKMFVDLQHKVTCTVR